MVRPGLPHFGREESRVEPNKPHRFRETSDSGLAAMAGSVRGMGARGYSAPTQLIVTNTYLRESRCGLSGCQRPRQHAIHELADE